MSVELDPAELGFRRPFTQEVSQVLRLANPHSDPVAFKVKTTAPKQYCVRPNSGRIEAGQDVQVQVLLQAMKEDPPLEAKCRDKFLVQSVAIPADKDVENVSQIWGSIEQTDKKSIQERKIRVVFLPPEDGTPPPAYKAVNGVGVHDANRSPSPEAVTPRHSTSTAPSGSVSKPESRPADSKNLGEAVASANNPATSRSSVGSAANTVGSYVPTSSDELKAQLAEAKATIAKLRSQAEEGLRQRKPVATSQETSKGATATQEHATAGGVSLQITAVLCLLSFLLAYFLF